MFSRSHNYSDPYTPLHLLKERVCQVIDAEIQNEIKMHDLSEDEYIDIAINNWEKFYSCCEQYHIAAHQPIGLFVLDTLDAICCIKNNLMSFLRPCDVLENMLLSGSCPRDFSGDERLVGDLGKLVKALYFLENQLSMDVKIEINSKLYQLEMPNLIVQELVSEMASDEDSDVHIPRSLIKEVSQQLQHIQDIPTVMNVLLNLLRLDRNNYQDEDFKSDLSVFQRQLFAGDYGSALVTETVRQISASRFAMTRNLLIVQQILIDGFSLNCNAAEIVRSRNIPETVIFLQAYYVMVWIGEEAFASPLGNQAKGIIGFSSQGGYAQPSSLLQLFIKNQGLLASLKLYFNQAVEDMDEDMETDNFWSKNLLAIANFIEKFIWAISGRFIFGEWLAETNQNLLIEEYVRLLNKWCEYNSCSRHFILANAFLDNGETGKALDMFLESAKGVLSEPYLMRFVGVAGETTNEILSQYYLKVSDLLLFFGVVKFY
jgi:nuclear pore complex protein Nup160